MVGEGRGGLPSIRRISNEDQSDNSSSRRCPIERLATLIPRMNDEQASAEVVDGVLKKLVDRLQSRDVAQIMNLFTKDALLFGSEAGEVAQGTEELQAFFTTIFEQRTKISWTWDSLFTRKIGESIWFVGPAMLHLNDGSGHDVDYPYRLSGVLLRGTTEPWVFTMFNGSEPASH